jgi:hypothetical protein
MGALIAQRVGGCPRNKMPAEHQRSGEEPRGEDGMGGLVKNSDSSEPTERGRKAPPDRRARPADVSPERIASMTRGSSTMATKRRRPPQRGQVSTSISNARRMRSAHAQ